LVDRLCMDICRYRGQYSERPLHQTAKASRLNRIAVQPRGYSFQDTQLVGRSIHVVVSTASRALLRSIVLLLLFSDHRIGGQQQGRNARGILQGTPDHLRWVDDALLQHVAVFAGPGIVTEVLVGVLKNLAGNHVSIFARVIDNLAERRLASPNDDVESDGLIVGQFLLGFQSHAGPKESDSTTRQNPFLVRGLGCVHRILDPHLLFLDLALGRSTHIDLGHAARELGDPLAQLFLVVVAGALVQLFLDAGYAAQDRFFAGFVLGIHDQSGVVLVHLDLFGVAELFERHAFQLDAQILENRCATS